MTTIVSATRKKLAACGVPGRHVVALACGVLCVVTPAWGAPLGPEFRINMTTADSQTTAGAWNRSHAVARSAAGFVIVWQSEFQDGSGLGVFARVYDAQGTPQTGEILVNETVSGDQHRPSVGVDTGNRFLVVWEGNGTGDADGVFVRHFDEVGTALGPEFLVNETTAGLQSDADVALDNGGDFVVVWSGNGPGDSDGVFVRSFASNGSARSSEQRANLTVSGTQSHPAVGIDSNDDHVVTWDGPGAGGDLDIFFRRFSGTGIPQGPPAITNSTTGQDQSSPSVARAPSGRFVIVWEGDSDPGGSVDRDVYAQGFNDAGSPNGSEFRVNSITAGDQIAPSVDLESSGDYVVTWTSDEDPSAAVDWNVRLSPWTRDGNPLGSEIVVPTTTAGPQRAASIAVDDVDNFVVVWGGNGSGDDVGVFARLFGTAVGTVDVALSMIVDDALPQVGDQINFFITLVNNGPEIATGVRVTDVLPAGLTYVGQFATQGDYDEVTGFWDVASMSALSSDNLQITAQVTNGTQGQTLANTAAIIAVDQFDAAGFNNSATVNVLPQLFLTTVTAEAQATTITLPGSAAVPVFRMRVTNNGTLQDTLQSVALTNTATGPGTQDEMDESWSTLELRLVDEQTVLASGRFVGGRLTLAGLAIPIAAGDSLSVEVLGAAATSARDGDTLDLRIDAPADIVLSVSAANSSAWPLDPPGSLVVDGMASAQILVFDVPSGNVFSGSSRNLGFDFVVPANGYAPDELQKLNIVNFGSAVDQTDVEGLEAWVDDGDGAFDPQVDRRLGGLVFTGNRWELTALSELVPVGGLRLFVSVDLAANANVGGTIRLGLADDTDVAIGMASANDGPLDSSRSNRFELSISTNDRITLNAASLPSSIIQPGARAVLLMHVATTNSYPVDKQLLSLALTNATVPTNGGAVAQLDAQFELLNLHRDGNGNGAFDGAAVDPIIATSFFSLGRAPFDAFSWNIGSGMTQHLFVSGDISLDGAADGDVLSALITDPLDLAFSNPTAIIANWPVDSGARLAVDGMVAAQVTNHGAAGVTLGPGDGPVLALDLTLPPNGYADDVLQGVTLQNSGTTAAPDLSDMRIWRDGGDGVFTPGTGDDTEVGPLVVVGSSWKSPQLAESIGASGLRLFVGTTVAAVPSDSTSLRLEVPVGGIQTNSGNDGPLDSSISNPHALLVSSAPLLATLAVAPSRSLVGQTVDVQMTVRNVSTEAIRSVTPSPLTLTGTAPAALISGPTPAPVDLAPSSATTFQWTYRATGIGEFLLSGNVEGTGETTSLPRRSLHAFSNTHAVLTPANPLLIQPVGTMPFSVIRGETNVVPLSLTLSNTGDASTAEIALTEIRLRVEDDAGTGLVAADVLSRIALSEGATVYGENTALPTTGSEVLLILDIPVVIRPNEPVTVSLRCDVAATTQEPEFRIAFTQSNWFAAVDAVSGQDVGVALQQGTFPVLSGTGQIRAAPTQLDVAANPTTAARAGHGQTDVLLLELALQNDGVPGLTSDVLVSEIEFSVLDANNQPLVDPSRFFESIRVKSGAQVFEEHTVIATQANTLHLAFTLPMTVPVNSTTELTILGDVAFGAPLGDVHLRVSDPAMFIALDVNTNLLVPVAYANPPLEGGTLTIEAPATSLRARGNPALPTNLALGSTAVVAMTADLRHPDAGGVGRIRVQSLRVSCRDEARRALGPDVYIDQLRVLQGTQELARVTQLPPTGDFDVPISDLVLDPGQTTSVVLEVDFETTAPRSFFELVVPEVSAHDENLATPVVVSADDGAELPLVSGLAQLESPATELVVGLESRVPPILVGDGSRVPMARLALTNPAIGSSSSIQVNRLVLRGGDRSKNAIAVGLATARTVVSLGDQIWATSDSLTGDSLTVSLRPSQPLIVPAGKTIHLDVFATLQSNSGLDGFRMGLQSQDVGVIQPASAVLRIQVESEAGATFPLWTDAGSFGTVSLRESFANFPNPFAAGRESTTFAFYLSEAATVSLRILSPRGELVESLIENAPHEAGMHQTHAWRGRNQRNRVVTNGVFIAELRVLYAGGRSERVLRKVAVVR